LSIVNPLGRPATGRSFQLFGAVAQAAVEGHLAVELPLALQHRQRSARGIFHLPFAPQVFAQFELAAALEGLLAGSCAAGRAVECAFSAPTGRTGLGGSTRSNIAIRGGGM
jgi:hypothetical protein